MHDDYSVRQLAECTGLSDRTIRNYLASGILEGEKTEGSWRFTPEQVIGALACAAGLFDRPEPVAARELAADFAWDKIPRQDLFLPDVFREGR